MTHSKTFITIAEQIASATHDAFDLMATELLSGGDISRAYKLSSHTQDYFVKLNSPQSVDMFEAEMLGLHALDQAQSIRIPKPIVSGVTADAAYLVLEFIPLWRSTKASERLLGTQLAQLHAITSPYFGWHRDNTIGSSPQQNTQTQDWLSFWRQQRLGFQLKLAAAKGYGGKLQSAGEKLCLKLDALFIGYDPKPSLLHGDLWCGNAAVDTMGNPVIYDPACYFGDRETDIAMTELFGGFSATFYAAYNDAWPLDQGYQHRKNLYNLYHVLNHLNLFGGSYLSKAELMILKLLAEIG